MTLIGVSHVGTKDYYNYLQKIADSKEVILYEKIDSRNPELKGLTNDLMKSVLEVLNYKRNISLVLQKEHLIFRKDWLNADINFL